MADVQPLRALRYDTRIAGPLADVTAPPYDVISPSQRAGLLARSPQNIVAVDLPQMNEEGLLSGDGEGGNNAYRKAGALFSRWQRDGVLIRDDEPALWAHTQEYTGPDGVARTRRGFFCRVRLESYGEGRIRPHERTHAGPKEDRLRLMEATAADLSPIFCLHSDPSHAAWEALAPSGDRAPDGDLADPEGTVHRVWRVSEPDRIAAVQDALRDAELLIADGHHRYETARTYAEQIGGDVDGPHRYVLVCLVAMEDPGLTIFPTHRLVGGLDAQRREDLLRAIDRDFEAQPVAENHLAPPPGEGPLQLGYIDWRLAPMRLRLRSQAVADLALPGRSATYRQLDTGVLEALLLGGALGLTEEDISELRGLRYARTVDEAVAAVRSGAQDAAFIMRPTPIGQMRSLAAAGESMPPKSTYFFPKLLTGLLISPLQ